MHRIPSPPAPHQPNRPRIATALQSALPRPVFLLGHVLPAAVITLLAVVIAWNQRRLRALQLESVLARLQARTDPLTGLPNRVEIEERLTLQADHARPVLMLVLLDLDGFKQVNDTHGHDIGDQLLTVLAQRLINITTDNDETGCGAEQIVPARLAGDEFVLLWHRLPDDPIGHVERLLHELTAPAPTYAGLLHIGASAGIALAGTTLSGPALLHAADAAMYQAQKYAGTTTGDLTEQRFRLRLWTDEHPPARPDGTRPQRRTTHRATPALATTPAVAANDVPEGTR